VTSEGLVVRGARVLLEGGPRPAAVHVSGGRISAITECAVTHGAARVVEAGERLVSPGLVDSHVHVNDPGRAEWEGFPTATAAAAAGGVTTIVDMPLNSIPATTSAAGFDAKLAALEGNARVDVALWGGLVPGNTGALAGLAALGVAGVKCFMSPSGAEEFPHVTEDTLEQAMPVLAALGLPLLVHAESPPVLDRAAAAVRARGADPRSHAAWLASRPPEAEREAIELLVRLCRRHGTAVHVVHVTCAAALEVLRNARAEGLPITAETCPHYLAFAADEIADGATAFKCAPPIRAASEREALWRGLEEGVLDLVASDHSPCPPALKRTADGDFFAAWGGIASLQLLLPALWTAARGRGLGAAQVIGWTAANTARLAGLGDRKGRLAPGYDADLVVWDEEAGFTVEPGTLHHRHTLTPWTGRSLKGVVHQTWVRGALAFDLQEGLVGSPAGGFLPVHRR
jgi:allantoinase